MNVTIGGQTLHLHCSGVALWRDHGIAIVSDLHLEKGSHFAKRGYFIPPYDTHDTLQRLLEVCQAESVKQLILLGDCFHDPQGYSRLDDLARQDFELLKQYDPIWIKGNHDKDFVPDGFQAYHSYSQDGLTFVHEAQMGETNEISGHFHPKAGIVHKGGRIDRPCFVEDGNKMILPAFGSYTGGLYIDEPMIRDLFGPTLHFHLLGERKVYSFKAD
jgi:DNA ligase-associated metallophosphoesterase